MTLLPNPPLTTGSFLATSFFEDVAWLDCTAENRVHVGSNTIGDRGVQRNDALGLGSFLLVGQKRHFSRSRQDRVGAPGCAGQGRHLAAREAGRLVARRSRRAKIGRGLGRFLWSAIENQAKGIVTPKGPRRRKRLGRARRGRARPRGARVAQTIFEIDQKKDPHAGVSIHRRA